jgi:GNAT superfamily N-acetyltransferase
MWPAFLNQASDGRWKLLDEHFPGYQMLLVADKHPVAVGHTVPLAWNQSADGLPDAIEDTLSSAIDCREAGNPANTLAVLGVFVSADWQGNGLSALMLEAMKQLANEQGLASMIVPVRPAFKSRYPLVSMTEYIAWTRADGSPFDPTIRYHWKAGATVMKTAAKAMTVIGTVADWENWTEMRFAESGEYIVDGALKPVLIDLASDHGWYEDPFLWMHHLIQRKNDKRKFGSELEIEG